MLPAVLLLAVLIADTVVQGFYFPGWRPEVFRRGQKAGLHIRRSTTYRILNSASKKQVDVWFNKIFSDQTQLPFAYSDLPFVCPAAGDAERGRLNLGELFRGDRIVKSQMGLFSVFLSISIFICIYTCIR